jgi:hypothetical protein
MTQVPRLGQWRALTGPAGASLAVAGDYIAAAGLDSLSVWRNGELLVTAQAGSATPGRPRFVLVDGQPHQVCWGTVIVDLPAATWRLLDGLSRAATPEPAPRIPGRGGASTPRPTDFAWSTDGSMVLVARQETGAPQSLTASAALLRPTGEVVVELWHGLDLGPVAGLVGPEWTVVGCRQPRVFSREGHPLTVLDGTTPPQRIESDAAEARVLTVEAPALHLWETSGWQPIASAQGLWADASISCDGAVVLAVDYDGRLQVLDRALRPAGQLEGPGPVQGISVGNDLVAVAAGGRVHCARWLG